MHTLTCTQCGKEFEHKSPLALTCSTQCRWARKRDMGIRAKCIICGKDFLTSKNSKAKTFCMPCPWATHKLDTLPLGVTSWSDPIMDPLSGGFPMRTFSVPKVAREAAA